MMRGLPPLKAERGVPSVCDGPQSGVEVKTKLAAAVNARLEPIRERRAAALARPGYLREVVMEGSKKARAQAIETMTRVRQAVNLVY